MSFYFQKCESPVGDLYLVSRGEKLCAVCFECNWESLKLKFKGLEQRNTPVLTRARRQLQEYFLGKRRSFELEYEFLGTEFQVRAWHELLKIPFGETRSYGEQARSIRAPKAARAIGRADGMNPLAIVVPCHRVVGRTGALTGFGGGLSVKKYLLDLECSVTGGAIEIASGRR